MEAMHEQADTVFLLTSSWGSFMYSAEDQEEYHRKWFETSDASFIRSGPQKGINCWMKRTSSARRPASLRWRQAAVTVRWFACIFLGPRSRRILLHQDLGVKDFTEAFQAAYKAYAREQPSLGIKRKKQSRFSLNIVYFKQEKFKDEKSQRYSDLHEAQFKELAGNLNGELSTVAGLAAIKSYVSADDL